MMAGDWIKMRVDLGDDPAVVQIAARLDTTEDEVVGKLHRLWSWADKHTTDGTAPGITPKWVDRYVSCTGFADAMVSASWLSFDESGIAFPGFDRHNGESAKRRVEATLRQRLSRKNRDEGVTGVARSTIPRPFIRYVMRRDAYTCVYCGEESSEAQENSKKSVLSVDHVKPISRGGAASVDNLACCCRKCNGEKNDRTPEEWGLLPTFLQPGVSYIGERFVTEESQKFCDTSATREEKDKNKKHIGADAGFCFKTELLNLGARHELVTDWMAVRSAKKARNTKTALDGFVRELGKSGWAINDVLRMCCERNWQGFNAEWVKDSKPPEVEYKPKLDTSLEARRAAMQAQADESYKSRAWLDGEKRYRTVFKIEDGQIKPSRVYDSGVAA